MEIKTKMRRAPMPIFGILGAALVVLKVLGMSTLSWTWTLSPFWIPIAVLFVLVAVVVILTGIVRAMER